MSLLKEFLFNPPERKIPLDQPPLETLPQWGHWLETPEMMVAMIPPGHLEVNIRSPLNLVVTSFGETQGIAAFTGFGNQSHMTSVFKRMLNITPKRYQQEVMVEKKLAIL